jgi:hypothetical protein
MKRYSILVLSDRLAPPEYVNNGKIGSDADTAARDSAELAAGAPLKETLEAYARLAPLGALIRAHSGDQIPRLRCVASTSCL